MNFKTILVIFTLMIPITYSFAQVIETESFCGKIILKASVKNLYEMYWMTTLQWETEMKKLKNYEGPFYNPQVEYTASNMEPFFTHTVIKDPSSITIMCTHSSIKTSIMQDLFNEIEPYYSGYEDNTQTFYITIDNIKYVIFLTRSTGNDMVMFGKQKK